MILSLDHSHSTVTMKKNPYTTKIGGGVNHQIDQEYVDGGRIQRRFVALN